MMGLHPTSVKENFKSELQHVKDWIDKKSFVAIGEIGIDLYWDKTFLAEQQEAFKLQIQWAKQKNIPYLGKIPFDTRIGRKTDTGSLYYMDNKGSVTGKAINSVVEKILKSIK